ncbi:hypothetical protein [Mechercharimyces sp. CAU 1602]|uniref:hypothetical protein n=1 Tax=Mechercharimyces sp. CAU 1602 TaxID=2973933 RepID=UPI002162FD33|nr:hypothetical protein [Mechercharimyces sp. CAU 1602]MCS1352411.1 hypothetical protein [Mechercharimyces sp. CAU 1602]
MNSYRNPKDIVQPDWNPYDQENKELRSWLVTMDAALERLFSTELHEWKEKLDFSADTILIIKDWLDHNFVSYEQLSNELLDGLARYVGEVMRRPHLGHWYVDIGENSVYYGLPCIQPGLNCPHTWVTASFIKDRERLYKTMLRRPARLGKLETSFYQFATNEEELQAWMSDMEKVLDNFFSQVPSTLVQKLDFTPSSLPVLEEWMLARYPDAEATRADYELMDGLERYLGETFRRELGGEWLYCDEADHPFAGFVVLDHFYLQSDPLFATDLIINPLTRRTGTYLKDVLTIRKNRMG